MVALRQEGLPGSYSSEPRRAAPDTQFLEFFRDDKSPAGHTPAGLLRTSPKTCFPRPYACTCGATRPIWCCTPRARHSGARYPYWRPPCLSLLLTRKRKTWVCLLEGCWLSVLPWLSCWGLCFPASSAGVRPLPTSLNLNCAKKLSLFGSTLLTSAQNMAN